MSKIVVIGANHAGTAAINTILDNYKEHEVVVFDQNSNISFLGCGMALWIGNQIDGAEGLFYSSKEKLEAKGATIHMETAVTSINYDEKVIHAVDKDGKEISESYEKLIIASGSIPIIPNIPGKDLENVQMVKLYQNAAEVIDKLQDQSIQRIVVVGAGYIGVELAEAFERCGKEVRLVDCADTCLANYYDKEFSKEMEENLAKHNITLSFNETVQSINGNGKVESVTTDKGT
ncbi:MAG: FAD-dependent oxidoreductase, partial [Erysipelotrichaceae bacterium]|nr:FAD-dependent oxidoreductase [Erysipelotrichaceae bacterium]